MNARMWVAAMLACSLQGAIRVTPPGNAGPVATLAAEELRRGLARLYPDAAGEVRLALRKGRAAESFTVNGARLEAADERGLLFAVYALLERLGYGFYLSNDSDPAPRKFEGFASWKLADAPVASDRVVFNWHNFLSSGSAWELEDWQRWIAQSAKMRYNTVMVHAYGNNPMFTFRFNGVAKPVGYLATTARGRDWGTQHVNDVRRLVGGEIFHGPVFGAGVALVEEARRAEAATALMQKVFAYARGHAMHVTFALDVDTESANPQEMIRTLPAGARVSDGRFELANPDTPEGYAYYKAQIAQLLATYPEIDRLAMWFRTDRTPWRNVTPDRFPAPWKAEFEAALARRPELRKDKDAHGMFAMSKLLRAFGRALRETGHGNVELAAGSWRLYFLPAADHFFPREVTLLPLDWETIFDTEAGRKQLRAVRSGRKLLPVVWAHHDDRTYIGRPYTPYRDFAGQLRQNGAAGFGIIHWTTRPLDLYFKSLAMQVWRATENEPLDTTCAAMAQRTLGSRAAGAYLARWVREAPMFGRETGNRFIDVPLKDPAGVARHARERIAMLEGLKTETAAYFRDYEEFTAEFFASHAAWERAEELRKKGDTAGARRELLRSHPERAIRQYVRAASHGRMSRGEQALVVSLNLRWLPYIEASRQALGMEPLRIRFAPTQHEPLAQGAGANTFYFDEQRRLWKVLGEKETGGAVTEAGLRVEGPRSIAIGAEHQRVRPIFAEGGAEIAARKGRLELRGGPAVLRGVVVEPELERLRVKGRLPETEGGRPFFWLGDTSWRLVANVKREDLVRYFEDRAEKGFNVLQTCAANEPDWQNAYGHPAFSGGDYSRPQPEYWAWVDEVADAAARQGIYLALLPMCGGSVPGENSMVRERRVAYGYGRFLGERYRGRKNIIWVLGGDDNPARLAVTRALSEGIADGAGAAPIADRPCGVPPADGQGADRRAGAWEMRRAAYRNILAGFTCFQSPDTPEAIRMGPLRRLMEARPYWTGAPAAELITAGGGEGGERALATRGEDYAMVYMPSGRAVTVRLPGTVWAAWFDPRTGEERDIGRLSGTRQLTPPSLGAGQDWVLTLDETRE